MTQTLITARVLVVEDHGLLAESLVFALRAEGVPARHVIPDAAEQVLAAVREAAPTVVLLDLDLGAAVGDSTALIARIRALGPLVVMLTGITDRARLAACLEAGACGLLDKRVSFDGLVGAVKEVVELGSLTSRGQRDQLLSELRGQRSATAARMAPFERLTPRELAVLGELVAGRAADDIARRSFVSLATVRSQIRSLLQKLGVNSQLQAVALARRSGWELPTP